MAVAHRDREHVFLDGSFELVLRPRWLINHVPWRCRRRRRTVDGLGGKPLGRPLAALALGPGQLDLGLAIVTLGIRVAGEVAVRLDGEYRPEEMEAAVIEDGQDLI